MTLTWQILSIFFLWLYTNKYKYLLNLKNTWWDCSNYKQTDVCLHVKSLTCTVVSGFPVIHRSWLILQYFLLRQGEVKSYTQWQTQLGRKWPQRKPQANYRYSLWSKSWTTHIDFFTLLSHLARGRKVTLCSGAVSLPLSNSWITFANRGLMLSSYL